MPTLDFAHKHIVERHHEQVPFQLLKPNPRKGIKAPPGADGNMIIHGNNLEALQALKRFFRIVTKANLETVIAELKARGRA